MNAADFFFWFFRQYCWKVISSFEEHNKKNAEKKDRRI